jgi:hypothetical protein
MMQQLSPKNSCSVYGLDRYQAHWRRQVLLILLFVGAIFWSLSQQSYAQTPNRTGTNVALGKPATQSSTYPPTFAPDCFVAAKAVNGNTSNYKFKIRKREAGVQVRVG